MMLNSPLLVLSVGFVLTFMLVLSQAKKWIASNRYSHYSAEQIATEINYIQLQISNIHAYCTGPEYCNVVERYESELRQLNNIQGKIKSL